jgi:DNA topoisomerase-1
VAKSGQFGLYVSDGAINATVPKDEPLEELTPERAFELLAIRRERLGLEPGQAAPKTTKAGRRSTSPARTVKKGATRKKSE